MKKLALAAVLAVLPGCAQQMLSSAQKDCSAFGFAVGTNEYASCVQSQYGARAARFQNGAARLQQVGSNMQQAPVSSVQPVGSLASQYVQGQSRICTYNRLGSPYVVTIGAAELCPISTQ